MRSRSEHSSRFLPMTIYTRPVQMLLCGLLLLTTAIAVLNTLVPLWLAHENMPTWQVGMVGSSYFTGNLAGTLLAGWVIKRTGFNRSYYLASLIFAVGCVGLGITVGFWTWLSWRFIAGVGCAMIWVVVESALVCSGTSRSRGRLLAAYMMVYYVGTVLGQLMVSKLPTDLMSVLPWVTGLALAAILPLLFTRIMGQAEEPHETVRIWPMLKLRQGAPRGQWLYYFGDCPRLAVWPDAAVAEPSGRQRLRHRLLDGGDGECGDPRPVAGRAPGRPLRSPAGAAGTGLCGHSGMSGDA